MKNIFFVFVIFISLTAHGFDEKGLWKSTKPGKYSKAISDIYDDWMGGKKRLRPQPEGEIKITAIPTKDNDTYVGIASAEVMNSKMEDVISALKMVADYGKIYPDLEEIKIISNEESDSHLYWKFGGALGTHTIYDTVQRISKSKDRAALIYRLSSSEEVLEADGLILLEKLGSRTLYFSVDFFDAKWGIAGSLFKNKIWSTTCRNTTRTTRNIEKISNDSAPEIKSTNCEEMLNRKKQGDFEKFLPTVFL